MGTRLLCSEQAFKMVGLDAHLSAAGHHRRRARQRLPMLETVVDGPGRGCPLEHLLPLRGEPLMSVLATSPCDSAL